MLGLADKPDEELQKSEVISNGLKKQERACIMCRVFSTLVHENATPHSKGRFSLYGIQNAANIA